MQDYITMVVNHLKDTLPLFAPITMNELKPTDKSIAIRIMPVAPGDRYMNGQRARPVLFQVLTKSTSDLEAMNTIESIADELEGFGCPVQSEPSFLQEDGKSKIHTATFRGEIIKGVE